MKWEVVLTNRKIIYVDDDKKKKLEEGMLAGGMVEVDGSWFDTRSIKGIFPLEDKKESVSRILSDSHIREINDEFSEDCARWAAKTPEEKAKREMQVRIVPFWKLEGGKREDKIMLDIYEKILDWFVKNKEYPRCPMWVWGPMIRAYRKEATWNHLANIIQRNDNAIADWLKYKRGGAV